MEPKAICKVKYECRIKYEHEDTKRLNKIDKGDWIDVYADEDAVIPRFECVPVSLGFSLELPTGHEAYLAPRSSTFRTWGCLIANSPAVIDESFCGNGDVWKALMLCIKPNDPENNVTVIKRGDKIAQMRINSHMPIIEFKEVDSFENNIDRGGFGTTGKT